jgi:hypothetical protein
VTLDAPDRCQSNATLYRDVSPPSLESTSPNRSIVPESMARAGT